MFFFLLLLLPPDYSSLKVGDEVLLRDGTVAEVIEKRQKPPSIHDITLRNDKGRLFAKNSDHGGEWGGVIEYEDDVVRVVKSL